MQVFPELRRKLEILMHPNMRKRVFPIDEADQEVVFHDEIELIAGRLLECTRAPELSDHGLTVLEAGGCARQF